MKAVIIGASGRIGRRLVGKLRRDGCSVVAASRRSGVNTVTGEGLASALDGADVVIDVSNAPVTDGDAALRFFEASGRNLRAAAGAAGVRRHVVLSIVGVEGLVINDYFRAKLVQEAMVRASDVPFTILRSTQFYEFISALVQEGTDSEIAIPPVLVQPLAAQNVADALAAAAWEGDGGSVVEIAGPEQLRLDAVATEIAALFEDGRRIIADPHARYFGAEVGKRSLLPGPEVRTSGGTFDDWLRAGLQPDTAPGPRA